MDAPPDINKQEREHRRSEPQLGELKLGEDGDAVLIVNGELVQVAKQRERGPSEHERVNEVPENDAHHVASGSALGGELEECAAETPKPSRDIREDSFTNVEVDAEGLPLAEPAALDAKGEVEFRENVAESANVPFGVGVVPHDGVAIVDLRGQDGPRWCKSRRRTAFEQKLTGCDDGPNSKGAIGGEKHCPNAHRVAEVQRPVPPHGKRRGASKDVGIAADVY